MATGDRDSSRAPGSRRASRAALEAERERRVTRLAVVSAALARLDDAERNR